MKSLLGIRWRQSYLWFVNRLGTINQNFENVGDRYSFITLWPWVPSITHSWEKSCKLLRFTKYFWILVIFNWVSNTSFFVNKWKEKFFYLSKQHFSKLYFVECFDAGKWLVDFQGLTSINFYVFIVIVNGQ